MSRRIPTVLAIAVVLVIAPPASSQCVTTDFSEYALTTPITTQIDGVTFVVMGQSCDGDPALYNRVTTTFYGDTLSSKALVIDTGCPDFSDDYMRMVFDDYQSEVRFTIGPWATTYEVRAYGSTSGGSPLATQNVVVPGTGFVGVNYPVVVQRPTREIRRIEIETSASGHEAIDNLRFGQDSTPPNVQIDFPAALDCVSGEITVTGVVCDDDGAYDRDRLEYLRTWPDPQTDWTLVREYVGSPVCASFSLYSWDTTEPEVTDGVYVLRVTAINECGLVATEEITVYVDNDFDSVELRAPATGDVVGSPVCFDGTAWERTCFDHYVVQYRPASGGAWQPIDPLTPEYASTTSDEPLGWWTAADTLPDGDYFIAVAGYTTSGASSSEQMTVTLDNTPPTVLLDTPLICSDLEGVVSVTGTAYDVNLDRWELEYWDPVNLVWVDIVPPQSAAVVNGLLANWDTNGLPACYYNVRLRAWDRSVHDNCGDVWHHRRDHYVAVAVGAACPGDVDGDRDVDLTDLAIVISTYATVCD